MKLPLTAACFFNLHFSCNSIFSTLINLFGGKFSLESFPWKIFPIFQKVLSSQNFLLYVVRTLRMFSKNLRHFLFLKSKRSCPSDEGACRYIGKAAIRPINLWSQSEQKRPLALVNELVQDGSKQMIIWNHCYSLHVIWGHLEHPLFAN